MKNLHYIESLCEINRDKWFAERRSVDGALCAIERIYGETCTMRPDDTLAACRKEVGEAMTEVIFASLVNRHGWDGRISKRAKIWANTVAAAYDEEACVRIGIYTDRIHLAHLDQIARELYKQAS